MEEEEGDLSFDQDVKIAMSDLPSLSIGQSAGTPCSFAALNVNLLEVTDDLQVHHSMGTSSLPSHSPPSPGQILHETPPISPHDSFDSLSIKANPPSDASDAAISSSLSVTSSTSSNSSAYLEAWTSADIAEAVRLTDEAEARYTVVYTGKFVDVHMRGSSGED